MREISILIGGRAGDGIEKAGELIARIFTQLGYRIYIERDYPSLIRGGHTFAIIRAAPYPVSTVANKVDFLLALNQECINRHSHRLTEKSFIIYDSDNVKSAGYGIPLAKIIQEEQAPSITRNSALIGALTHALGIDWTIIETVLSKNITKQTTENLKVARRGYEAVSELTKLPPTTQPPLPIVTGNQAIGLGLLRAGLNAYIAYPMTPASSLLHFLAEVAPQFSIKVIHPENEIGVMLMALGFSYAGKKVAVGTSGGGFCLMTEGVSLAGMAELPVVIIVAQRTGPSTGLPTYTAQSDLHFVLNAGQGEFPRLVVAPGNAEQAYYWSAVALNMAWRYQVPSIILSDKTLSEATFSFDLDAIETTTPNLATVLKATPEPTSQDENIPYRRYLDTPTGVSPLRFPPYKDAVIKINSYEHDEFGITTEDPALTQKMCEKRLRKDNYLRNDIEKNYPAISCYGSPDAPVAIVCWGSNQGVCQEIGEKLGLRVIQPVVIAPFPLNQLQNYLTGVTKLICVENNATGQLARLLRNWGIRVDHLVLKYNGRCFFSDELEARLEAIL